MRHSLISAAVAVGILCITSPALANPIELTPVRSIAAGISKGGAEAFYAEIHEGCRDEATYQPFLDGRPVARTGLIHLVGCIGDRTGKTSWAIFNGNSPILIAKEDIPKLFRVLYRRETVVLPLGE